MRHILSLIALAQLSRCVSGSCEEQALGMEENTIPDERITSSSIFDSGTPSKNARLRFSAGNSWCAKEDDSTPYLQVDLGSLHAVCAVATQGNSKADQWVETYQLKTSTDGTTWTDYEEGGKVRTFQGNFDRNLVITQVLYEGLVSRYVRVMPKEWYGLPCLRVELNGANGTSCGAEAVGVAYSSKIRDYRMTATSYFSKDYMPFNGRLHAEYCWVPKTQNDRNDYLQVDLGGVHFICAVATQGNNRGIWNDWTTEYEIVLSMDNLSWSTYEENGKTKKFNGNTDTNTVKMNYLVKLPKAKFIRFRPTAIHDWPSLRVEVYGALQGSRSSLGIESRSITDSQISAQSNKNFAKYGRLYRSSSWCSTKKRSGYLQVDLGEAQTVTGVATQGDPSRGGWVKTYLISYTLYDISQLQRYTLKNDTGTRKFEGNVNNEGVRVNWLPVPIVARYIRVVADSWTPGSRGPCLRIDLYGCKGILRPRVSLKSKILTLIKGNFVDVTCNVTSQSLPVIQWWHNYKNVTSLSVGLIPPNSAVDGLTMSTLRVNFTSVDEIATTYKCARNNMSSRAAKCVAFSCTAFYPGFKSETMVTRSAAVTVTLYVPNIPLSVEMSDVQEKTAIIHWSNPAQGNHEGDISSFFVKYHTRKDPHNVTMATILEVTDRYEIVGLKPYTNYSVKLAASSSVGEGLWSEEVEFRTTSALPEDAPLLLSAVATASDKINITWERPDRINGPLLGYNVSYTADGGTEQVKLVQGERRTFGLVSLKKWTKYKIQVRVFNDKGSGPYSEEKTVRTMEDVPSSSPSGVAVEDYNATAFNVSWRPLSRSQRNGIVIAYEVKFGYTQHSREAMKYSLVNTTEQFVLLLDLLLCTKYSVAVRAYTGTGPGPYSAPLSKWL